jgi:pilus assembly protein CpaC
MNRGRPVATLAALLSTALLPWPGAAQPFGQSLEAQPIESRPRPAPQAPPQPVRNFGPVPVTMEAGTGRLLQLPGPANTVLAADPRIARVQPASPTSLFITGVAPGRTTVVATAENGTPVVEYNVLVRAGANSGASMPSAGGAATPTAASAAVIEATIRQLVRGAGGVTVRSLPPNALMLSGSVLTAADAERAEAIARGFAGEERNILNQIETMSSIQVNLRVRVLEVSREVTRNLGLNWQALGSVGNFVIGLRSGQTAATVAGAIANGASSTLSAPARIGLGARSSRYDVNAIIDALAEDRLATILAEPNLTAQSGETASFLAGGEFPVPVAATLTGQISIQFKPFGVSLSFVPVVLGPDRLNLRVRPEVSDLSDNGAISVPLANGSVRIPAVTVRRAETTVEVGSGQSFAIAGLLTRTSTQVGNGVAGLGELPVFGALFRSESFRRGESELVIIVTPYLVRPVSEPERLVAPTDGFRPANDLERLLYRRQIARGEPARQVAPAPLDVGFILP